MLRNKIKDRIRFPILGNSELTVSTHQFQRVDPLLPTALEAGSPIDNAFNRIPAFPHDRYRTGFGILKVGLNIEFTVNRTVACNQSQTKKIFKYESIPCFK